MTDTDSPKAVVVGGAGFIGSHITDALIEKGFTVEVIDDLSGGTREHVNPQATFHELDIRNFADIAPVIDGARYVFHMAALPRVQFSIENPVLTNDVNVGGTLNVLCAARDAGVARVVYAASSSAYGDTETLPLSEDMMPDPVSPYGVQKHVGELYSRMFSEVYDLPTVSLRFFNVYGPRLDPEGPYALVIGKFLRQRAEGEPLTITGDGEQTRDFTHVRDVVRANLLAAESSTVGRGEVINIGAGRDRTINALAELIGGEVTYIAPRVEPRHTRADNTRARGLLGWEPEISLEEGVEELLKEWQ